MFNMFFKVYLSTIPLGYNLYKNLKRGGHFCYTLYEVVSMSDRLKGGIKMIKSP